MNNYTRSPLEAADGQDHPNTVAAKAIGSVVSKKVLYLTTGFSITGAPTVIIVLQNGGTTTSAALVGLVAGMGGLAALAFLGRWARKGRNGVAIAPHAPEVNNSPAWDEQDWPAR